MNHYLAKKGYSYEQKLGWRQVDKPTEAFQFYLLKASNELAKEKVIVNTLVEQNIPMVSTDRHLQKRGRRGCDQKSNL